MIFRPKKQPKRVRALLTVLVMCGTFVSNNIFAKQRKYTDQRCRVNENIYTWENRFDWMNTVWSNTPESLQQLTTLLEKLQRNKGAINQKFQVEQQFSQIMHDSAPINLQKKIIKNIEDKNKIHRWGGVLAENAFCDTAELEAFMDVRDYHLSKVYSSLTIGNASHTTIAFEMDKEVKLLFDEYKRIDDESIKENYRNIIKFYVDVLSGFKSGDVLASYEYANSKMYSDIKSTFDQDIKDHKTQEEIIMKDTVFNRIYHMCTWSLEIPGIAKQQYLTSSSWYNFLFSTTSGKSILAISAVSAAVFTIKKKKDSIKKFLRQVMKVQENDEQEELDDLLDGLEF